jgi:hypothetical protein
MRTRKLFVVLVGLAGLTGKAQNVQSNALATSGGLEAGTTTSGLGNNTFYGYQAGKFNSSVGTTNTFIGSVSGANNTSGFGNFFGGAGAGSNNVTGSSNVAIGNIAGRGNVAGNNNVYIGAGAGFETGNSNSGNVFIGFSAGFTEDSSNKLVIGNGEQSQLIWGDFAQNQLKFNGKVGVGFGFGNYPITAGSINVSAYNLFVKGGILTEEVRVSLTGTWADYVFNKNYKLPSLEAVEKQIQEKGYLFNVPSAAQVKEDGIELGEMTRIQQEKIEELTLYIIEQNKTNKTQTQALEQQSQEIAELKAMVKSLANKK